MLSIESPGYSTKKCPFCAEEILVEARKCRYCGEFFEEQRSKKINDPFRRILAIVGSLLLLIAPFAPFISAPIFGRITLFQQGKGDGVILMIVALAALGFALFERYGFLWLSGIVGLFEIGNLFWFFYNRLPEVIETYRQEPNNTVSGSIATLTLSNVDPDWGAMVLLLGTIASLGVAISVGVKARTLNRVARIGLTVLLLVALYQTIMLFFPLLRYWPSLLKK